MTTIPRFLDESIEKSWPITQSLFEFISPCKCKPRFLPHIPPCLLSRVVMKIPLQSRLTLPKFAMWDYMYGLQFKTAFKGFQEPWHNGFCFKCTLKLRHVTLSQTLPTPQTIWVVGSYRNQHIQLAIVNLKGCQFEFHKWRCQGYKRSNEWRAPFSSHVITQTFSFVLNVEPIISVYCRVMYGSTKIINMPQAKACGHIIATSHSIDYLGHWSRLEPTHPISNCKSQSYHFEFHKWRCKSYERSIKCIVTFSPHVMTQTFSYMLNVQAYCWCLLQGDVWFNTKQSIF